MINVHNGRKYLVLVEHYLLKMTRVEQSSKAEEDVRFMTVIGHLKDSDSSLDVSDSSLDKMSGAEQLSSDTVQLTDEL